MQTRQGSEVGLTEGSMLTSLIHHLVSSHPGDLPKFSHHATRYMAALCFSCPISSQSLQRWTICDSQPAEIPRQARYIALTHRRARTCSTQRTQALDDYVAEDSEVLNSLLNGPQTFQSMADDLYSKFPDQPPQISWPAVAVAVIALVLVCYYDRPRGWAARNLIEVRLLVTSCQLTVSCSQLPC